MPNIQRTYTGGATVSALASAISASSPGPGGTFAVTVSTGWPSGAPFIVVVDRGTETEETILCSSRSSELFVVAPGGRGYDGTLPHAHGAGAVVEHRFDAESAQAFVDHLNDAIPSNTHPMLMRTEDHDLAAHDSMGLQTTANHTKKLHTDPPLSLLGQAEHNRTLHENLGLLFEDEHTRPLHEDLGILFEDEHTVALHDSLNIKPMTKANIDPLDIDAETLSGLTRAKLASWSKPIALRVAQDASTSADISGNSMQVKCTLTPTLLTDPEITSYMVQVGGHAQFYNPGSGSNQHMTFCITIDNLATIVAADRLGVDWNHTITPTGYDLFQYPQWIGTLTKAQLARSVCLRMRRKDDGPTWSGPLEQMNGWIILRPIIPGT